MAEHDPFSDLRELARVGEQYAHPLPAERVRQLGQRRRYRRQIGFVAAVVLAGVPAGGAVTSLTGLRANEAPGPVATPTVATPPVVNPTAPTASASPARTLTQDNLISADEVPHHTKQKLLVVGPDVGRSVESLSVCVPEDGFGSLGAVQVLSRNFRFDALPSYLYRNPQFYTTALQFSDESTAREALTRYRGWLADCASQLRQRGYTVRTGQFTRFVKVPSGSSIIGEYAALPTYLPPGFTPPKDYIEHLYFEHVGLTQVEDRLMITVEVVFSNEYHDSDLPKGDPETGLPPNVQFGLVKAAAERLAR
jgi:hypothetical protein